MKLQVMDIINMCEDSANVAVYFPSGAAYYVTEEPFDESILFADIQGFDTLMLDGKPHLVIYAL